ncbi:MAG: M28 family peptidase [Planctomycetales bacterium]|nr:M28 family peptidase [Planctomycetales bacterium]
MIARKSTLPTLAVGLAVLLLVGASAYWLTSHSNGQSTARRIPVDGDRAYGYLKEICQIGPRPSGSPGMLQQQRWLTEHFATLGGRVSMQEFSVRHPETGDPVAIKNMLVEWHPERRERILLCAHYDTRPFPDRDRTNPRGVFVGANDGGSGVALLAELAHHMGELNSRYGVDFVLFDGEELVFDEGRDKDYYFLGSTHFAQEYARGTSDVRYRAGVLFDMVGDADLQLYYEVFSLRNARDVTLGIWKTAQRLGVDEFKPRSRHEIRDDHLPLNNIAKIPTCDLIDFDYPRPGLRAPSYWHTEQDTVDKCSGESLAKVGWVVLEWLKSLK